MSTATKNDALAEAIRATLISPNVSDSNYEAANLVDAMDGLTRAFRTASSNSYDANERLCIALLTAGDKVASAIGDLADAIRDHT